MIAITIDCEQWNLPQLRGKEGKITTDYSREGNKVLLKILKKHKIKATFFVTGYFAEKEAKQVKEISKNHEVACHGYSHFYRSNPSQDIENDINRAKKVLERTINKKVFGFRAPQMQFSMKLLKILNKKRFRYDSSLHPAFLPGYYINLNYPIKPFIPKEMKIKEIPAAVMPYTRLPISWFFMRNLGWRWAAYSAKELIKKSIIPILYFHSWEFFPVKDKNVSKLITRNTGKKFANQFEKLLDYFKNEKFVTLKEI